MSPESSLSPSRGARVPLGEALGIAPVIALLGLVVWLLLVQTAADREAGPAQKPVRPAPLPAAAGWDARSDETLLIAVTVSEERAREIRALAESETALRALLGEPPRHLDVISANSDDEAVLIVDAIRGDEALRSPAVIVQAILIP